ncbi:MAG: hypothetical protein LBD13_07470 [Spirochaetaceae bacterium]|nr:hypothetical protein [Spirochaetaceae bacterium]
MGTQKTYLVPQETFLVPQKLYLVPQKTYLVPQKTGFPIAPCWYSINYRRFRASLGRIWGNQFPQTPH